MEFCAEYWGDTVPFHFVFGDRGWRGIDRRDVSRSVNSNWINFAWYFRRREAIGLGIIPSLHSAIKCMILKGTSVPSQQPPQKRKPKNKKSHSEDGGVWGVVDDTS